MCVCTKSVLRIESGGYTLNDLTREEYAQGMKKVLEDGAFESSAWLLYSVQSTIGDDQPWTVVSPSPALFQLPKMVKMSDAPRAQFHRPFASTQLGFLGAPHGLFTLAVDLSEWLLRTVSYGLGFSFLLLFVSLFLSVCRP